MAVYRFLLLVTVLSTVVHVYGIDEQHICNHRATQQDEVVHGVYIEPTHVVKKRSIQQPLRIHLHFHSSLDDLPTDHAALITSKVIKAVDFWSDTLRVRGTQAAIKLKRQCINNRITYFNQIGYCSNGCKKTTVCGEISVPEDHLQGCYYVDTHNQQYRIAPSVGSGVEEVDFILYVAAVPSQRCQRAKTVAYASHCQIDSSLDRPIAGYFSVCPNSVSVSQQDQYQLYATIRHEILHALGFTAGLYAFYRDKNGEPLSYREPATNRPIYNNDMKLYQWSRRVIKTITRNNWRLKSGTTTISVKMMVTPNVMREVRRHFNCSSLEGAELEDQGIDGTALTHWEKRVFENEAMTGTYTQNPVISRITLALMEDTGWYKVNYSKADAFDWGKNLGCDFVKKSCYDWITTRKQSKGDIHPFCDKVKTAEVVTDCTRNRNAIALCNLVEYVDPLPQNYQYFTDLTGVPLAEVSRYGGSVSLADYCPYLQEFTWRSESGSTRGSQCSKKENSVAPSLNYFGESYGNNSKCFNHNSRWTLYRCHSPIPPRHTGSGCYRYECSKEAGLIVHIADRSYQCIKEGQILNVNFLSDNFLHRGDVICPSCQEICQNIRVKGSIVCPSRETVCLNKDSNTDVNCAIDGRTVIIDKTDESKMVPPCAGHTHVSSCYLFLVSVVVHVFIYTQLVNS